MTFIDLQDLELATSISADDLMTAHMPHRHTNSAVATFSTCEQKWYLRYVIGLVKRRIAAPLIVGTLYHAGLEHAMKLRKGLLSDPLTENELPDTELIVNQLDLLFEKMIDEISEKSDMVSANDVDKLEYCRVQALAMVEAWCVLNMDRFLKLRIIDVETEFRIKPFEGYYYGHDYAFWSQWGGKLDAVVENPAGKLFVVEHKSRSRMDTFNSDGLALDQQSNFYMSAYSLLIGKKIDGTLYDVMMKPQHKMSAKGSTDLRLRMRDAILAAPEKYSVFTEIIADQEAVKNNLDNMYRWIERMKATKPYTVTRNTSMCDQYGGCAYRQLCQSGAAAEALPSIAMNNYIDQFHLRPINTELSEEPVDE